MNSFSLTPTAILTVKTIASFNAALESGTIPCRDLADIANMKNTNIENLITKELKLTIFPPGGKSKYWYLNIPRAKQKTAGKTKLYGKTKEELLEKAFAFFFGEDIRSMTI